MKKTNFTLLRRLPTKLLLLLCLCCSIQFNLNAQCISTTSFGGDDAPAFTGVTNTLTTCNFTDEFTPITNAVAGETYEISDVLGIGVFYTITDATSTLPALATGTANGTNLAFTAPTSGDYRVHVFGDAACGTAPTFTCIETSIICTTCPAPPAAPANDVCSGAVALTVGTNGTCTGIAADNTFATDSGEGAPTCGLFNGQDLWFSAVVPASGELVFDVTDNGGGVTDGAATAYTGGCGALTFFQCNDDTNGLNPRITVTAADGLAGQTIHIQVYTFNNSQQGSFDVCAYEPPPVANNNFCIDAEPITPDPEGTGCAAASFLLPFTIDGTTDSGVPAVCSTPGNDQWFTWTATTTGLTFSSQGPGNPGIAVFASCADADAGTDIDCLGTFSTGTVSGWNLGDNLLIQIYDFGGSTSDVAFCLEEFTVPPPPANDLCSGAIALTVDTDMCVTPTLGSNVSATDSGDGVPSCASYAGGDTWFSMVVPADGKINVEVSTAGGFTDSGMSVYTGACGTLVEYECNDDGGTGLFSLIEIDDISLAGQTVFVQVWEFGNNSFGDFNVCAFTPPPPPVNDFCVGAIPITPAAAGTGCATAGFTLPFSTDGTTDSGVPSVCSAAGNDQWFTWTATSEALAFNSLTPGNPGIAVFASCADADAGLDIACTNTFATSTISGWNIGDDLLIQIYDFQGSSADVAFCLEEVCTVSSITAGAQGACDILTNLYTQEFTITYSTQPATGTLDVTVDGMVFNVPIDASGTATFTATGLISNGTDVDVTATFSDNTGCTLTVTDLYTAPSPCLIPVPAINDPCICNNDASPFVITDGADPANTDGDEFGNDLDDGTFGEVIMVTGLVEGNDWQIVSATGLTITSSTGPGTAIGAAGQWTVPAGVNSFTINGTHLEGDNPAGGYTIILADVTLAADPTDPTDPFVVEITNKCFYARPDFAIPTTICANSVTPLAAAYTDYRGTVGTATYTIDGAPATEFDATALGVGTYNVEMVFDAGIAVTQDSADAGCMQTVSKMITVGAAPAGLSCNDDIQISLDANCSATVTPDMIAEGIDGCGFSYEVSIMDNQGMALGSVVDGSFVGTTWTVKVTEPSTGNSCWGSIIVEDKIAPVLDCPTVTLPCTAAEQLLDPTATFDIPVTGGTLAGLGQAFGPAPTSFTVTIDAPATATVSGGIEAFVGIQHPWIGDVELTLTAPSGNSVFFFMSNGGNNSDNMIATFSDDGTQTVTGVGAQSINGSFQPINPFSTLIGEPLAGDWVLDVNDNFPALDDGTLEFFTFTANYLGTNADFAPDATDNCSVQGVDLTVELLGDAFVAGDCTGDSGELTRTWVATDASGNSAQCAQIITFERPTLADVEIPADVTIDCAVYNANNAAIAATTAGAGYPTINGLPIDNGSICNISATLASEVIINDICPGTFKIRREWLVVDWCADAPNNEIFQVQYVKVLDGTGPTLLDLNDLPTGVVLQNGQFVSGLDGGAAFLNTANNEVVFIDANTALINNVGNPLNASGEIIDLNVADGSTLTTVDNIYVTATGALAFYESNGLYFDELGNQLITGVSLTPFTKANIGNNLLPDDIPATVGNPADPVTAHEVCEGGIVLPSLNFVDDCSSITAFSTSIFTTGGDLVGTVATNGGTIMNVPIYDLATGNEAVYNAVYTAEDACGNVTTYSEEFQTEDQVSPVCILDEVTTISMNNFDDYNNDGNLDLLVDPINYDDGSYDNCTDDVHFFIDRALFPGDNSGTASLRFYSGVEVFDCNDVNTTVQTFVMTIDDWLWNRLQDPFQFPIYIMNGIPEYPNGTEPKVNNGIFDPNYPQGLDPYNPLVPELELYVPVSFFTQFTGHYNVCMVETLVEDKLAPVVTCPTGSAIDCENYFNNYAPALDIAAANGENNPAILDNLFAPATYSDNCGTVNVDINFSYDVNTCGVGTISRTYTNINDGNGNVAPSCVQTINVFHINDWSIAFPSDVDLTCEAGDELDGESLGEPVVYEDNCELIAISVEDEQYNIVPDACYKIIRTYTAINWCIYDGGESTPVNIDGPGNGNDDRLRTTFGPTDSQICAQRGPNYYEEGGADSGPLCSNLYDDTNDTTGDDGIIVYKQVIKVQDNVAPVITNPGTQDYCIDGSTAPDGNCDRDVVLPVAEVSDCDPNTDNLTVTYTVAGLGTGRNYFNVVPGTYTVVVTAEDNCGNQSSITYDFVVRDCKAPTPYCVGSLVIDLMGNDTDGDGLPDEGMAETWASDFNAGSFDNCTAQGDLEYYVSLTNNFVASQASTGSGNALVLTCDNAGPPATPIYLFVQDQAGNVDVCQTSVYVESVVNVCEGMNPVISGTLATEGSAPLAGATVSLNTGDNTTSDANGDYVLAAEAGTDVTVIPEYNVYDNTSVTTFDLVLIRQHILTTQLLDSPYKVIAADINNSGAITASDLVAAKQVILGMSSAYPNNNAWAFVDAAYTFPTDWTLADGYPAVVNINNINDAEEVDFVAIRVGDVNGTYGFGDSADERNSFIITTQDAELAKGQEFTVEFAAADYARGYQFTLNFTDLELVSINGEAENFGVFADAITTSFEGEVAEQLFSVTFKATEDVQISEALSLNSRITKAEAYNANGEAMNIALDFGNESSEFALYQNTPNPFKGATLIGFNLPTASAATLTITDISGKVLSIVEGDYAQGYNEVRISELTATGVLYYTLDTDTDSAVRKMVVIK